MKRASSSSPSKRWAASYGASAVWLALANRHPDSAVRRDRRRALFASQVVQPGTGTHACGQLVTSG